MNGRFFGGQHVQAYVPYGKERFRKSGKRDEDEDDMAELGSAAQAELAAAQTSAAGKAGGVVEDS